ALVRAHLKLLARFLVHVRRAQYRPPVDRRRQRNWPGDVRAGALGGLDNLARGLIENSVIVRLQTDANFFSGWHRLLDDVRDGACADRMAAFADREAPPLFPGDRGDTTDL